MGDVGQLLAVVLQFLEPSVGMHPVRFVVYLMTSGDRRNRTRMGTDGTGFLCIVATNSDEAWLTTLYVKKRE